MSTQGRLTFKCWIIRSMTTLVTLTSVMAVGSQASAQQLPVPRNVTDPFSRMVLLPWGGDFERPHVISPNAEEVFVPNASNKKLRAWYFRPESKADSVKSSRPKTILLCLGNTGNISVMLPYVQILHDAGFAVLAFDYQGFGASEGEASCLSLYSDAASMFDWLVETKQCRPEGIGVFGVSLGSVLAIAIAADKNAGAVAVEDVFVPEDMIAAQFGQNPDAITSMAIAAARSLVFEKVNPTKNVARLTCPVFLLHGANDRLLPPSGTLKVAAAAGSKARVWLMDNVGHAPESLEVNDEEYADQLVSFYKEAFSGSLKQPVVKSKIQQLSADRYSVDIEIQMPDDRLAPVQICVGTTAGMGLCGFRRRMVQKTHRERIEVPYPVDHVSAISFLNAKADSGQQWSEQLSVYSTCLAQCRLCYALLFASSSESVQHPDGASFYFQRYRFPKAVAKEIVERLPEPASLPDRIRPRYARLLARLQCWPATLHESEELEFAERMLSYMPSDPDRYYELGNARIEIGFRDAVVGDALFRLARHRLRNQRIEEARQFLHLHVRVLPPFVKTNLTPERIASISKLEDLDVPQAAATQKPR